MNFAGWWVLACTVVGALSNLTKEGDKEADFWVGAMVGFSVGFWSAWLVAVIIGRI